MPSVLRTLCLGLLAAVLSLPAVGQVRLQVIHNAADPAAAEVDVYVNGALTLNDFAFRAATGFLDLPSDTDLTVAIAPGSSSSAEDAVFSQTFNLPTGAYQLIANGVLSPSEFADNPDGEDIAFQLLAGADALEAAPEAGQVAVRVVHGATDAPTVDVRTGGAVLVDDAAYPAITGYLTVDPASYTLDVTTADGSATAATFTADLSGAAGGAVTVLASGFLTPDDDQDGPAFGLLAVFPDGTTALLPVAPVSVGEVPEAGALLLGPAAPNPIVGRASVAFSLDAPGRATLAVFDTLGRRVATLAEGEFAADRFDVDLATDRLAAGTYVLRLDASTGARTRTVTVVR